MLVLLSCEALLLLYKSQLVILYTLLVLLSDVTDVQQPEGTELYVGDYVAAIYDNKWYPGAEMFMWIALEILCIYFVMWS